EQGLSGGSKRTMLERSSPCWGRKQSTYLNEKPEMTALVDALVNRIAAPFGGASHFREIGPGRCRPECHALYYCVGQPSGVFRPTPWHLPGGAASGGGRAEEQPLGPARLRERATQRGQRAVAPGRAGGRAAPGREPLERAVTCSRFFSGACDATS